MYVINTNNNRVITILQDTLPALCRDDDNIRLP